LTLYNIKPTNYTLPPGLEEKVNFKKLLWDAVLSLIIAAVALGWILEPTLKQLLAK
jgi:hypothetical protein